MSNTHNLRNKIFNILLLCLYSICVCSCSSYSSKFECRDSLGMPCFMMREIDKKIDSGEIDKAYIIKCRSSSCKNERDFDKKIKTIQRPIKAKIIKNPIVEEAIFTEEE